MFRRAINSLRYFTACKLSLGQGIFFTPVCDSVHTGESQPHCMLGYTPLGRQPPPPPGQTPPLLGKTPYTPPRQTAPLPTWADTTPACKTPPLPGQTPPLPRHTSLPQADTSQADTLGQTPSCADTPSEYYGIQSTSGRYASY